MKIYENIESFGKVKNPVVTIGTFDGVHLGHQEIFRSMLDEAAKINGETVVITFHPHPRLVIHPDSKDLKFINIRERKYQLIEEAGIDHLIVIPFTREFSNTSSLDFVRDIVVGKVGARVLIVGHDHHFGKDRQGSFGELKGLGKIYGFEVIEIGAEEFEGTTVSSTKIRNALIAGEIKLANQLLGYEYSITGKVVEGNKIGRTLGFPTANIETDDKYKLISAVGVYACRVEWKGKIYLGMGNIGFRPTIEKGDLTIEVHIFDFDSDIYGECISIYFVDRIRDEVKFKNLSLLRNQLVNDKATILSIFS